MGSKPSGRVGGAIEPQRTSSRTYDAPAARVIVKPPGFPLLRWKGSNTAVRNGGVFGVVYVLPLLVAKLADAAVAVRQTTATEKETTLRETRTARNVQAISRRGGDLCRSFTT